MIWKESFCLQGHTPDAKNSQGCARVKPGMRNADVCHLLGCSSRKPGQKPITRAQHHPHGMGTWQAMAVLMFSLNSNCPETPTIGHSWIVSLLPFRGRR